MTTMPASVDDCPISIRQTDSEFHPAKDQTMRYKFRFPVYLIVSATFVLLTGCSQSDSNSSVATENPFDITLSVAELMSSVVDPAADALWDNAGWIESAAGYEELYPTTDEGWDFVRAQSALIAEIGNMLALPGRALDNDAWMVYSEGITEAGFMAMRAAEERNEEDFFQAGAQLYSVCSACHQAYSPEVGSRFVQDGQ